LERDFDVAMQAWQAQPRNPLGLVEMSMIGDLLAHRGEEATLAFVDQFRQFNPVESDILLATYLWKQGRRVEASTALVQALQIYQLDPWAWPPLVKRSLHTAVQLAREEPSARRALYNVLMEPFSLHLLRKRRVSAAIEIGKMLGPSYVVRALEFWEPHVPWERELLELRAQVYAQTAHPRASQARRDLQEFLSN
jgi:hypothetical protein